MSVALSTVQARRLRADALRDRYPFTAEPLTLYLALLDVHEQACATPPDLDDLPGWASATIVPAVVAATVAAGPAALGEAVAGRLADGAAEQALAGWLAGAELEPVDRYLARASLGSALEALGEASGAVCAPAHDGGCPCCGGPPQLAWLAASGEALVTGPRNLLCARCGSSWTCSRSVCPACGEREDRLLVYAEHWTGPVSGRGAGGNGQPVFPHLRIAGCTGCRRYLIEVDLARDGRAVPEVDELAALPLDLYAADQGLTKVTPNLMGF